MSMTIDDLSKADLQRLVGDTLTPSPESIRRRSHIALRHQIMTDTLRPKTVGAWISDIYETPEIAEQIAKYSLRVFSPLKKAVNRLAVAYRRKPGRGLRRGKRVLKTQTKTLTEFLRPLNYDLNAQEWNRWAIAVNTVVVLPIPKMTDAGTPTFDFQRVLGSAAEVIVEPLSRAIDPPGIMSFLIGNRQRMRHVRGGDEVVCVVDSQFFTYFNARRQIVRVVVHGLGTFPGVVFRNTMPEDIDPESWWDAWTNEPVIQTEKHVARIVARMNWTRETNANKVGVSETQDAEADDGIQIAKLGDPGWWMEARGKGIRTAVHDMVVQVEGFENHIHVLQDEALEQMTGAVATVSDPDPDKPLEGGAAKRAHNQILLHQGRQIDYLIPGETRMLWILTQYAQLLGIKAVEPQLILDAIHFNFPELPFFDDPLKRQELRERQTKFGIYDQVEARREDYGETSEEAEAAIMEIAERLNRLNAFRASRQLPADPMRNAEPDPVMPGERPEAETGRFGGRASPDGTRPVVETPDQPTDAAADPEAKDPKTALNGAQIQALNNIVGQVARGEIPFESAVSLVTIAFPVDEAAARELLNPAVAFTPDQPEDQPAA